MEKARLQKRKINRCFAECDYNVKVSWVDWQNGGILKTGCKKLNEDVVLKSNTDIPDNCPLPIWRKHDNQN